MSENNDYIQLPPLKKDTPSDVVAFMWKYMKVPENSREKVKNLLKDANENGVKLSHQAPTLYDVRTNLSMQVIENVRNNLNQTIYDTIIPRGVRLAEAPSHGLPITKYDRRSAGAQAYLALADEVIERSR